MSGPLVQLFNAPLFGRITTWMPMSLSPRHDRDLDVTCHHPTASASADNTHCYTSIPNYRNDLSSRQPHSAGGRLEAALPATAATLMTTTSTTTTTGTVVGRKEQRKKRREDLTDPETGCWNGTRRDDCQFQSQDQDQY